MEDGNNGISYDSLSAERRARCWAQFHQHSLRNSLELIERCSSNKLAVYI